MLREVLFVVMAVLSSMCCAVPSVRSGGLYGVSHSCCVTQMFSVNFSEDSSLTTRTVTLNSRSRLFQG